MLFALIGVGIAALALYGMVVLCRMAIARTYGQHARGQTLNEMTQERIHNPLTCSCGHCSSGRLFGRFPPPDLVTRAITTHADTQQTIDRVLARAELSRHRARSAQAPSHLASYRLNAPAVEAMVNGALPIQLPITRPEWEAMMRRFEEDMRALTERIQHA
jgi:hypothetical protein